MTDTRLDRRHIGPGVCTWCGHAQHQSRCRSRIQTGIENKRAVMTACPCQGITTP